MYEDIIRINRCINTTSSDTLVLIWKVDRSIISEPISITKILSLKENYFSGIDISVNLYVVNL